MNLFNDFLLRPVFRKKESEHGEQCADACEQRELFVQNDDGRDNRNNRNHIDIDAGFYCAKLLDCVVPCHKAERRCAQTKKDDIEKIRTVYDLVKVRGLKLAAARDVLKQNRQGVAQPLEAIQRLRKVREELMDMKRALEAM